MEAGRLQPATCELPMSCQCLFEFVLFHNLVILTKERVFLIMLSQVAQTNSAFEGAVPHIPLQVPVEQYLRLGVCADVGFGKLCFYRAYRTIEPY